MKKQNSMILKRLFLKFTAKYSLKKFIIG